MRPPPRSLEELLYRKLVELPRFQEFVKRIHHKINRIPYEDPPHIQEAKMRRLNVHTYKPTAFQKFNAFRIIWVDEMKRLFGFKR